MNQPTQNRNLPGRARPVSDKVLFMLWENDATCLRVSKIINKIN